MAATDARPVPRKSAANRIYVEVYNTAGALITGGLTGASCTISKDGAAFAAPAGSGFAEIGTTGCGYVDLNSTDCAVDHVKIKLTVSNTDAVTVTEDVYLEEAGDIRVDVTQINADATLIAKFAAAIKLLRIGTIVGTPTATEIQCADLNDAQADLYIGSVVGFLTGALAGSKGTVTDYVKTGSNGVFTISSQPTTATAGDLVVLV